MPDFPNIVNRQTKQRRDHPFDVEQLLLTKGLTPVRDDVITSRDGPKSKTIKKLLEDWKEEPSVVTSKDRRSTRVASNKGKIDESGSIEARVRNHVQDLLNIMPRRFASSLPKLCIFPCPLEGGIAGKYCTKETIGEEAVLILNSSMAFSSSRAVIWHLLGHWIHLEGPQGYRDAISERFTILTAGEDVKLSADNGFRYKRAHFSSDYAGKIYDGLDPGTELLAVMGTESIANGTIASQLADPHCRELTKTILGIFGYGRT
jgi:hypothetical protein